MPFIVVSLLEVPIRRVERGDGSLGFYRRKTGKLATGYLNPNRLHGRHAQLQALFHFQRWRRWSSYFNRAPLGTSSVKVAITGLPASPTEAASSIPCDS